MNEQQIQLRYIAQNLESTYGIPDLHNPQNPLDELINTILSQSTTNLNSDRAFANLKARYSSWEEVRLAPAEDIADAIKSGGLANVKSVVIKGILQEIYERSGKLDLGFLHELPLTEAMEFLTSLKGVGPKTARCVLLFASSQPVFPIDTHIFRILRRLELLPIKCSDAKAHELIAPLIPDHKHLSLHINLILHGRQICHPRNPQCNRCCLLDYCPVGQQLEHL